MKHVWMIILVTISVCFVLLDQCPAFYQWEDENGVVHFGDAPSEGAENIIEKTDAGNPADAVTSEEPLPSAVPREKEEITEEKYPGPGLPADIQKIIETVTLAPHTKKQISFAAFSPVKVGFRTDITPETVKQCQNSGAGIKDTNSGKEVISPYGGSFELAPHNGYVKFFVGNLEDFPIEITVFKY